MSRDRRKETGPRDARCGADTDGLKEKLPEFLNVLLKPAVPGLTCRFDRPIACDLSPAVVRFEDVARRQPLNTAKKCATMIALAEFSQQEGQHHLIVRLRHLRQRGENRPYFRAEKQRGALPGIMERLESQSIARTEQGARPPIPEGKGEVAVKLGHRLAAPAHVGREHKLRVSSFPQARALHLEVAAEVGTIVEPAIPDEPTIAHLVRDRLMLVEGLRRREEQPMGEADRTADPGSASVAAPVGNRTGHAVKDSRLDATPVGVEHANEAAHPSPP